jgi:ATP sulfurylase
VYGLLDVEDIYEVDTSLEAQHIYGTTDSDHPGVKRLYEQSNVYVGGKVTNKASRSGDFGKVLFRALRNEEGL